MDTCELCGEKFNMYDVPGLGLIPGDDIGEFGMPDGSDNVIAHADCGFDAGLELA